MSKTAKTASIVLILALVVVGGVAGSYYYGINSAAERTKTEVRTTSTTIISTSTTVVSSTIISTSIATVMRTNVIINGGFENGFKGWEAIQGNRTILLTQQNPHSGAYALEFVTGQRPVNETLLYQHINLRNGKGECTVPGVGGTQFGVAVRPGLELSFWYRTPNSTADRIAMGVTFHNGTSKPAIDYLLAWKGAVPKAIFLYGLGGVQGDVPVLVNASGPAWKQAQFDLYQYFVTYIGIDPVANHYCVNYIDLAQQNVGPTGSEYCFLDDVQMDEVSQ